MIALNNSKRKRIVSKINRFYKNLTKGNRGRMNKKN